MDMYSIWFPQGNDVVVQVHYGPEITDDTGLSAEFLYKDNRYVPDGDPTSLTYTSDVFPDDANPGGFMSQFTIPGGDNAEAGAFWYRVDVVNSALGQRRTVDGACGTLLVEAV